MKPTETSGMKKNTRNVWRNIVLPPTMGDIIASSIMKNRVPTIMRVM